MPRDEKIHSREWRAAHPNYQRRWRKKQGESHREYMREYMRKWRLEHPRHKRDNALHSPSRYAEWIALIEKHGFKCFYCTKAITKKTATRDHMTPVCRGGSDEITNIVPTCKRCNDRKAQKTAEEFKQYLREISGTSINRYFQQEAPSS